MKKIFWGGPFLNLFNSNFILFGVGFITKLLVDDLSKKNDLDTPTLDMDD